MNDYSKMSEFDINEAVSMALLSKSKNPEARYVAIGNYCSSWADAGPIAESNFIGVVKTQDGWCATSDDVHDDGLFFVDEKPCRAICIVFLMINEGA